MRVLVVDDSESMRSVIASYVAELGIKVIDEAADGSEALRLLGAGSYDCLFLDVHLPGPSGIDVLTAVRSGGNLVPAVVVSTETSKEYVARAFEAGATDYLPKPFDKETFLRKARRVLGLQLTAPGSPLSAAPIPGGEDGSA